MPLHPAQRHFFFPPQPQVPLEITLRRAQTNQSPISPSSKILKRSTFLPHKISIPTWYTRKEQSQATAHWLMTRITAHLPPNSRFTAVTAATQGV